MAIRPKLQISITEKDLGIGHFLKEAAKLRKNPFVKAGVTQSKGSKLHVAENEKGEKSPGKKTVADIAQIHEFGAPDAHIPERSFLRSTKSKNQEKYNEHIRTLSANIFDAASGMTVEKALGIIGQEYVADVKNTIRSGITPPLSESTIRAKNAGKINQAKSTIDRLGSKTKLTEGQSERLVKAGNLVMTGGASTPLIDTAQMINSITYEVVLDGSKDSGDTVDAMAARGRE